MSESLYYTIITSFHLKQKLKGSDEFLEKSVHNYADMKKYLDENENDHDNPEISQFKQIPYQTRKCSIGPKGTETAVDEKLRYLCIKTSGSELMAKAKKPTSIVLAYNSLVEKIEESCQHLF